ncbi:hypothetical protein FD755_006592 [Muntiacus reevesi]|uniref:C2 domain-containing protein n=1 Tax=Muntiacus reevesi TaxID=9886 RepID=A0A5J5MXC4_MUNRE|nr:hypothetical protein FD755_006592 [Muntiacus reevesi]
MLEPLNEGFLSRISDLLFCRWTCRHCCQKCYESSCCQSSEDEVEILGPFPAQTPPWLLASRSSDKDGDSVHTASDVPLTPRTNSPDRRCSSSDTSKSTYSLTRRISSLDSRRPSSPLIDIKPIEFGVLSAKKEPIQPSVLRRTYTPDDYFRKFEPRLYSLDSNSDDVDFLTDAEILSKYQLGMLHFSTQYDLLHNHLTVRVIEARDLPPPISHDGARQDMAHSNPYVKICLLPDQKNSKQTGVKRKTQKPVFEERYTFEIPFLEAQRRTLLLTVLDFDKFSRHCVIGKVAVPLCEVDLVKGGHWWKALIPSSQTGMMDVVFQVNCKISFLPSSSPVTCSGLPGELPMDQALSPYPQARESFNREVRPEEIPGAGRNSCSLSSYNLEVLSPRSRFWWGRASSEAWRRSFLVSFQLLVVVGHLGLQLHHSELCLPPPMAFSLCVSVSFLIRTSVMLD